ncbi:hypothetical protein [uncultured Winogradskyella sp.]|uniref:hypothetical protein n=1 Tax=Winogradskyella sp. 4-2091 TaxID=3381659 RepID=UPI0026209121|nr:hypothetical protein [uncultured Winogradskyella sp.]
MLYIFIGYLVIRGAIYLYTNQNKKSLKIPPKNTVSEKNISNENLNLKLDDSLSYSEKLNKTKAIYPFKSWRENYFEYDMEQYTQENCDAAKQIFDDLINKLINFGEHATEKKKLGLFKNAINKLNHLSATDESLIETGEREDLCELIDQITIASGLNPIDYADGEGIADLWREW